MEILIDSLLDGARRARGMVVIVDVLRAFTTAAVAFERGAEKIVLVSSVEEALALRARGAGPLCMGEVHGKRPDGFDFGNSPWELSRAEVQGCTLIHSTTAGTVGATAAAHAQQIWAAALVNAQATVQALLHESPRLVTLVAMGAQGQMRADEDELCALYLRNLLHGRQPDRDAVRALVRAAPEAQHYGDPTRPHFDPRDLEIALQVDSIPLAICVRREAGHFVARPVALA